MRSPNYFWIACGYLLFSAALSAEEPADAIAPSASTGRMTETTSTKTERYLGVVTEPISDALAAQLKGVLEPGRGLLVQRVLPDSPAAKAGVQPFDILSAADSKPLKSPSELKQHVLSQPQGRALKLEVVRGAKVQVLDVTPGERTVSRIVHRHFGPGDQPGDVGDENVVKRTDSAPAEKKLAALPSFSVGVRTRDGRHFDVEVRITPEADASATHKFAGTSAEIASKTKSLPESIQKSVSRQVARIAEDRPTLRSVQFRFQPRRDGNRQVLAVSLRKPDGDGAVKSFELQHPMGEIAQPTALAKVLDVPEFAAQLKELDPAIREKIESTLKTASLPAAVLKVEESQ